MKKSKSVVAESVSPSVVVEKVVGQLTDQKLVAPDRSLLDMSAKLGQHTQRILGVSREVADGFVSIGRELVSLRDDKGVLEACGYSDIYDYSEKVLGFKRTSAKNFVAVFERFGKDNLSWSGGKYSGYSFTQLVELLPVKDDIGDYKPSMTVQAIRDQKILSRIKSESDGFAAYLEKAAALCGSFLSGVKVSGSDSSNRAVSGSFDCSGKSYLVSFDVSFKDGCFCCENGLRVGKKGVWVWASEKTPSSLSLKLAAALRSHLKEADEASSKSAKERAEKRNAVPAWRLWYDLPIDKKAESLSPEHILKEGEAGGHFFFLADVGYEDDGFVSLVDDWYDGDNVPFAIYGFLAKGKIRSEMLVGLDVDGVTVSSCSSPGGMAMFVMRWLEKKYKLVSDVVSAEGDSEVVEDGDRLVAPLKGKK